MTNIKEIALKVAEKSGAVAYSPAPLRAVRGYSFTYEQLHNFSEAIVAELAKASDDWKSTWFKSVECYLAEACYDERGLEFSLMELSERAKIAEDKLEELAKGNEPVAWLSRESEGGRICLDVEDSGESGTWSPSFPVYELPPTASQIEQETAEAIVKAISRLKNYYIESKEHLDSEKALLVAVTDDSIEAIRSWAWKEFKQS